MTVSTEGQRDGTPEIITTTSAPSLDDRHRPLHTVAALLLLLSLGTPIGGQYMLVSRRDGTAAALLYGIGLLAFAAVLLVLWIMSPNRRPWRMATPHFLQAATPSLLIRPAIGGLSAILLLVSLATINTASARITLGAWVMSMLLALTAAVPRELWPIQPLVLWRKAVSSGWQTREVVVVTCIVLVGGLLRLYNLDGIPSGIHGDETGEALVAISVLQGKGPNPFGTAFLGDRALSFYLEAPLLALFGRTITAIRLYSALAGVVTLPAFYLLMRRLFRVRPAVIALALLAGSAVHVNFSRLALNVNQIPLLTCVSLYCLRRGQESRKAFWWLASGVVGGLAVYFAFSGALVAVTIALYFVYLLVTRRSDWRAWIRGGVLSGIGGAMALIPIPVYMLGQNDPYSEHAMGRLIFNNKEWAFPTYHTSSWGVVLLGQLKANLSYFFAGHDFGPFYGFAGAPMLAVVLGPLVALGLVLMLLRIKDDRYAMLALWYWTVVLFGGVLTIASPQSHRLLPAALAALAGVALVLDWLINVGPRLVSIGLAPVLLVVSVGLPLIAGYSDIANYYERAVKSMPWESGTMQGRYVASLGSGYRVYSLAAPQLYFDSSITRFLAPNVEGDSLLNPALRLPLAVPADHDLAFLVFPNMSQYLPLLRSLYPTAAMEEVTGGADHVAFTALRVPRAEITRWQGLTARYGDTERTEPDASALGGGAQTYPTNATWSGSIYLEQGGSYRFHADGPVSALAIDAALLVEGRQLTLGPGWHSIQIEGRLPDPGSRVKLEWQPPDQPMSVIPAQWLDFRELAGNLRASWTEGGTTIERRDRTIGFRDLSELFGGQGPVNVRWKGTLNVPSDGGYSFSLRSTGQTEITIDGKSVVTNGGDNWANQQTTGTVHLSAGPHSLSVGYSGRSDGGFLEALWQVPGEKSPSVIPPEALVPPEIAP